MGLATVTKTEWGYHVTGDTDPTPIWTDGRRYVRTTSFTPAAVDDTAQISTSKNITGADTAFVKFKSEGVIGVTVNSWHSDDGIPADNAQVTLSNGGAEVFIYLR